MTEVWYFETDPSCSCSAAGGLGTNCQPGPWQGVWRVVVVGASVRAPVLGNLSQREPTAPGRSHRQRRPRRGRGAGAGLVLPDAAGQSRATPSAAMALFAGMRFWLPKPSVPAAALRLLFVTARSLSAMGAPAAAGTEPGAPGLGKDLGPSPVAACSRLLVTSRPEFPAGVSPSAVGVPRATAAGAGAEAGRARGGHSGGALHSSDSPLTPQGLHPAEEFGGGPGGAERHFGDKGRGSSSQCLREPPQWLGVPVAAGEPREQERGADAAGFGSSPKTWGRRGTGGGGCSRRSGVGQAARCPRPRCLHPRLPRGGAGQSRGCPGAGQSSR